MLLLYINLGDRNPPYPALACNIPSARSPGQRFHLASMQGSSPSLRFVNRHGGTLRRAGWVAFTKWLISHLPATFATIIHIPRPLRPCIWLPRVPVSHVPASHTWCPQVPRLASPSPKSPHTRPDVPVPLLYTANLNSDLIRLRKTTTIPLLIIIFINAANIFIQSYRVIFVKMSF